MLLLKQLLEISCLLLGFHPWVTVKYQLLYKAHLLGILYLIVLELNTSYIYYTCITSGRAANCKLHCIEL